MQSRQLWCKEQPGNPGRAEEKEELRVHWMDLSHIERHLVCPQTQPPKAEIVDWSTKAGLVEPSRVLSVPCQVSLVSIAVPSKGPLGSRAPSSGEAAGEETG